MSTLYYETDYLMHHGILGMKWGIRRFQNKDGSLTSAGRKRYDTDNGQRSGGSTSKTSNNRGSGSSGNQPRRKMTAEQKKAIAKKVAIGVGVTAAVLAAGYGAKKYSDIANFKREMRNSALENVAFNKKYGINTISAPQEISKNWDNYSLKTKNTLMRMDKNGLLRTDSEIIYDDGYKSTNRTVNFARNAAEKRKTLSSYIDGKVAQRQDMKEAAERRKEQVAELKREAQAAYLNKSPDLKSKMNAYNIADITSRDDNAFKRAGTKLLAKATQGQTSKDRERIAARKIEKATKRETREWNRLTEHKKMTDDELITVIGRLRKEKEYLDLSSQTAKHSFGKTVARTAGETAIKGIATAGAVYSGKKILERTLTAAGFDGKQILREMYPKKK